MSALTVKGDFPHRPGNLTATGVDWIDRLNAARAAARAARSTDWRPLLVGVDLDGVNYPFGENYRAYLGHTGIDISTLAPISDWYFYRGWGQSDEVFVATCHEAVNAGHLFATGEPYPDTIKHWHRLIEAGHEIHVVTDRRFGDGLASLDATIAWLDQYRLPYDTITISADKTVINADAFIEDRTENYRDLDAAGINAWLINRSWNLGAEDVTRRVDSVAEFVDRVLDGRHTAQRA